MRVKIINKGTCISRASVNPTRMNSVTSEMFSVEVIWASSGGTCDKMNKHKAMLVGHSHGSWGRNRVPCSHVSPSCPGRSLCARSWTECWEGCAEQGRSCRSGAGRTLAWPCWLWLPQRDHVMTLGHITACLLSRIPYHSKPHRTFFYYLPNLLSVLG